MPTKKKAAPAKKAAAPKTPKKKAAKKPAHTDGLQAWERGEEIDTEPGTNES